MTLTCSRPFGPKTYGPGVYINRVRIINAEDVSGQELTFSDLPYDIAIKLTLDVGRGFNPSMLIGGNFTRNPGTEEVTGWGGAFVIQDALSRLGYKGDLDPENKIPLAVLEGIIGKEFLRLSYVSGERDDGKLRYSDWHQIASVEETPDSLAVRFKRSLTKGYPRNYRPVLVEPVSRQAPALTAVDDPF
jgi:hypothetical protein